MSDNIVIKYQSYIINKGPILTVKIKMAFAREHTVQSSGFFVNI